MFQITSFAGLGKSSRERREAVWSLAFVVAMLALCGVLAILQYRWVGEVSAAERDRLRNSLQESLNRVARDLNSELTASIRQVIPLTQQADAGALEVEIATRFARLRQASRAGAISRIAIATQSGDAPEVHVFDPRTAKFTEQPWPEAWNSIRQRLGPRPWPERGGPSAFDNLIFDLPLFELVAPREPRTDFRPPSPIWLIVELSAEHVQNVLLPELLNRHLSDGKALEYQVAVFTQTKPLRSIYESDAGISKDIAQRADASVGLLDIDFRSLWPRFMPGGQGNGKAGIPGRGTGPGGPRPPMEGGASAARGGPNGDGPGMSPPGPERMLGPGRWRLYVRHRAGSLEAVVARARWRNLAVAGGVLGLLIASLAALIRFTRRAQKMAQLQMDFVAGVSHELRTPLTVIHTAGYNLQGKLSHNPAQVERYGTLIQQESARLKELVEQILTFARMQAGHVTDHREPFSLPDVILSILQGQRAAILGAECNVDVTMDPDLPLIVGDALSLRHAVENLLSNALKYGTEGANWIGIRISKIEQDGRPWIEIRVADRGPGIPEAELPHIFDPFFRGQRARDDQVHGSGLGLNLVARIVDAHGGAIAVHSQPMKGAEFVVRIPAAAPELQDEFANTTG